MLVCNLVAGIGNFSVALAEPLKFERVSPPEIPKVVALVNGEEIDREEFEAFFANYLRKKLYHGGSPERVHQLRLDAIKSMVQRRLVLAEADHLGIIGSETDVDAQIEMLRKRYGKSPQWHAMEARLPFIREQLLDSSRVSALEKEKRIVGPPDRDQLLGFYRDNIKLFTVPRRQHLAVILIAVHPGAPKEDLQTAEQLARDLFAQLGNGDEFATLAKRHSKHASAEKGGDIGVVHEGELAKDVQAAIDALQTHMVTEPIRVLEGYALFHLQRRLPSKVRAFSDVRERALAIYRRNTGEEQWQNFLEALQARANVTINLAKHFSKAVEKVPLQ